MSSLANRSSWSRLDVEDVDSIARAVATVRERAGRLDVLVNNAGQNVFEPMLEVPMERVRKTFEVNVLGLLAVSQAVFPVMAEQRSGLIRLGTGSDALPRLAELSGEQRDSILAASYGLGALHR